MESKNFPEIIEYHAKKYPYKTFCIEYSTGTQVTYAEFDRYINQCCNFLEQKGIKSGDKVTVVLDNHLIMIIIYFATLRMNAAINPLPGTLSYDEIKKSVEILDSDMLFVEMSHFSEKADFIKNVYYLDENHGLFYDELKTFPSNFKKVLIKDESIACFYHTSGTTSNPKCIMYTHKNMVSLIHSMTVSFRFKFDDIHIGFLPLGHTAITNYSLLPVIYNASTLIICENFMKIRAEFWKIVNRFKATYVEMVPTLLFMMLNTPYDQADIENNKTLKYVGCGSAPLSLDTQLDYKEKFGIPVINLYGLSEAGPTHFDNPFREGWEPGSIGIPIHNCECIILREDKSEADINEIGEIALKGDNVFIGYYNNEEAYREVMYNDYFLTGDLGYKKEDGQFYFVDRKKDLIIKGGVNIVPGEVEEVLYQLKDIEVAAVIGIPDAIYGEDVVAFVKPVKNVQISEDEIRSYCLQHLQEFKCPKRVIIIDKFPLGPSKKILKRELKQQYTEGHYG